MAVICEGILEFRSYDLSLIAISITSSRGRSRFGVWAHVIPLHYVGGRPERRGRCYGIPGFYTYESPKIRQKLPRARYLMTFMVPRFFILSPRERLETIVHEIYHIHPSLRGDLRRFNTTHVHHGPTPALYQRKVKSLVEEALLLFPELLRHPLIAGDGREYEDHVRARWPRPQRVFRPDATALERLPMGQKILKWLKPLLGSPLLWAGVLLSVTANAVSVRTLRAGSLHAEPSLKSSVSGNFQESTRFEALRLSPKKTWVEVKGKSVKGWVPRAWVESLSTGSSSEKPKTEDVAGAVKGTGVPPVGGTNPDDLRFDVDEVMGESTSPRDSVANFDSKSDKFFAAQAGRLYEKPSRMAARFGIVERNDEFQIMSKSPDGQWTEVRLVLTGEEGWFPAALIKRIQEERLRQAGAQTVEGALPWGSKDHSWGISGGYFRNLMLGGLEGRPRDRFEVGAIASYWLGKSYVYGTKKATASFMGLTATARYLGSSSDGRLSGGVELGLNYHKARISQTGITDAETLATLKSSAGTSSVGFHLGAIGLYAVNEKWNVMIGLRTHVSTGPFASILVGGNFRF